MQTIITNKEGLKKVIDYIDKIVKELEQEKESKKVKTN